MIKLSVAVTFNININKRNNIYRTKILMSCSLNKIQKNYLIMMNADEIFNDVKLQVFDLLNYGETEVIFGEYLNQKFDVYINSENSIEVEYNGKSLSIECKNFKNTEYIARLIMHCFAKLYLNR